MKKIFNFSTRFYSAFAFVILFLLSNTTFGQIAKPVLPSGVVDKANEIDSISRLIVDNANRIEFILDNKSYVDKLSGEVEMHQDQTFFIATRLIKATITSALLAKSLFSKAIRSISFPTRLITTATVVKQYCIAELS